MMVTYVDRRANIYRLFRTDFSEKSVEKSVHWKIFTCTIMDFWVRKTQKWWNFHGIVQCYRLMLSFAVTLHSNFLHLITSSQTALVTPQCYIMVLCYMSVPTFGILIFLLMKTSLKESEKKNSPNLCPNFGKTFDTNFPLAHPAKNSHLHLHKFWTFITPLSTIYNIDRT